MQIDILTLFPEMFSGFLETSIIKRAREKKLININLINFRDYSPLNNHQVDDTPYGGGAGMLLRPEPIFLCLDEINKDDAFVILLSPDGDTFNQSLAKNLSLNVKHLIIICGHYEGFDERIKTLADQIISIGDFVLTGGEVPAMAITDAITRLIPGVINNESLESESFSNNMLDYPNYTKPQEYRGLKVPDILLSGNHQKIKEYRDIQRLNVTKNKRPDLLRDKND